MAKAGTYEIGDAAKIKCSTSENGCKGVLVFAPGEVYKFCTECGREKNKLKQGYSAYEYASILANYVRKNLVDMGDEFYFMQDNKTNGAGHTILNVQRYYNMEVGGYIDANKVSIKFTQDSASLDVHAKEEGPWSTTARLSTMDMTSVEVKERWLYSHTPDKLRRHILSELKGLWQTPIEKEKYDTIRREIAGQNITELARYNCDPRISKETWSVPMSTVVLKDFDPNAIVKSLKRYSNKQTSITEIEMFMRMKTGSRYGLADMNGFDGHGHNRFSMRVDDKKTGEAIGDVIVKYLPVPGDFKQVFITGFDFYIREVKNDNRST